MSWRPTPEALYFSRQDPEDPRLGEFTSLELGPARSTLWGYPDDEGVRLNGGRPGAALAPDEIRRPLYKMTPSFHWPRTCLIDDLGNLEVTKLSLEQRMEMAENRVSAHYQTRGDFLFTLGGGHDYAAPDGAGFLNSFCGRGPRPLIINFDAHLDVRPLDRGLTSGTPFRQLLERYENQFDLVEVGIQPHCNSPFHWEWALAQGAQVMSLDVIRRDGLVGCFEEVLEPDSARPVFLSLDIDGFAAQYAPGCSAPNPAGLHVDQMLNLWPWLFKSFDVRGLGVYEVAPPLDVDARTSRLAAMMIYRSLDEVLKRSK